MEEVIAQCPACGQRMRAPFIALGKIGSCAACGHRFAVRPVVLEDSASDSRAQGMQAGADPAGMAPDSMDEAQLWGSDPGVESVPPSPVDQAAVLSFCSPAAESVLTRAPFAPRPDIEERVLRMNAYTPSQAIPSDAGDLAICPRCQRLYRGLWDREETSEGIMCHRCANLTVGREPSLITRDAAAKAREHPPSTPGPEPDAVLPFHERYRGQLIYAVVCVCLMALVLVLPVEHWIAALMYGQVANAKPTMDPEWNRLFAILKLVLGLGGYYMALHLTFKAANRFEGWDWKETVPYVLKGAIIIYLWMIVCIMVGWYPLVGWLLFGMGAVLIPFILWSMYQLSVSEFLILAFFLGLTHPLLWAAGHLLYGVLAFIIT